MSISYSGRPFPRPVSAGAGAFLSPQPAFPTQAVLCRFLRMMGRAQGHEVARVVLGATLGQWLDVVDDVGEAHTPARPLAPRVRCEVGIAHALPSSVVAAVVGRALPSWTACTGLALGCWLVASSAHTRRGYRHIDQPPEMTKPQLGRGFSGSRYRSPTDMLSAILLHDHIIAGQARFACRGRLARTRRTSPMRTIW